MKDIKQCIWNEDLLTSPETQKVTLVGKTKLFIHGVSNTDTIRWLCAIDTIQINHKLETTLFDALKKVSSITNPLNMMLILPM